MKGLSYLAAGAFALGLIGCNNDTATNTALDLSKLLLGSYSIVAIGDKAPINDSKPTLILDEMGRASGSSGCNNYRGSYSLEGVNLTMSQMASSRKMCSAELMEQEQQLLKLFAQTRQAKIEGMDLVLLNENQEALLKASRN